MLDLLIGKDWTANRDEVFRRIADDVRNQRSGRILLVPEMISHESERRLCIAAGDTASRFAEVLSFTRLARRVGDEMGGNLECLDKGGRVVAMAAAARNLHSRLKAYAAVETKPEFLTGLIDAVDEFKRCRITSADLNAAAAGTEGGLSQKLEELSLLMLAYDSICQRGKRDPRDQEEHLLEQLEEGSFAQNHTFYIDGFPDFTRQHLAILEHIIRVSPHVTVSICCDRPDSKLLAFEKPGSTASQILKIARDLDVEVRVEYLESREHISEKLFQGPLEFGSAGQHLQVIRAQSAYEECLAAAQEILEGVQQGHRYRDYTLVCMDMALYLPLVRLVFGRMGIPVYQSGTEDILQENVVTTVLHALDAALSNFGQRETLRYLRSALSPLDADICDDVENYAIVWGIRGAKWLETWTYHPEGLSGVFNDHTARMLERMNRARTRAMEPLQRLRDGFAGAADLRQQVQVLYRFLEEIALERRLDGMAREMDAAGDNRSAQILNQLWEILVCALEQMHDVLGDTVWDAEHFSRLLRLLLSQYDVGTIPPVLDAVQMGLVSAQRMQQEKHLIVLGAEEGKLPGYPGSAGVLTDQERVALRQMGVPLTGGNLEGIQAEFAEIYGVFRGATETIRVYYSGEQPSYVCRRLAELAGGEIRADTRWGFAQADQAEAAAWLARFGAGQLAGKLDIGDDYERVIFRRDFALGTIGREHVQALYGQQMNLSASQIDRHGECRLSYFLKYGLRAQERREASVDPAEFGTYVHAVLENTAREIQQLGGFRQVSLDQTLEIAHKYSEEYASEHFSQLDSQRLQYLFRRNCQELDMVVAELWQELSNSQFVPAAFELGFGAGEDLPPIPVPNSAMQAIVRGYIDRTDIWEQNGNTYYRVVDYKTGRKDFDYCDVFNGVGLQMLLYMFALRSSGADLLGDKPVAAGVQYFPARAPYLTADGRVDAQAAEKLRQKEWKRRGLLLEDELVLQAMEPADGTGRMCYTVKKDGSRSGDLADRQQLNLLEGYVFRVVGKMVEDIASGNVQPNPYTRGTSHNACTFCPYGAVCHKADVEGRRNYKTMTAQRFWEAVEKEMSRHGG